VNRLLSAILLALPGPLAPDRFAAPEGRPENAGTLESPKVSIPVAKFLRPGEAYQVLDPKDVFGKPRAEGISSGDVVRLPLKDEFAAVILVRKGR